MREIIDFEILGIIIAIILLVLFVMDGIGLKKYKVVGVVESKWTHLVVPNVWLPLYGEIFFIEFHMNGKKYSTNVSYLSYMKVKKGDVIQLRCGKKRFSKILTFDFLM